MFGDSCNGLGKGGPKTCEEACNQPIARSMPAPGKEVVLKVGTGLASKGVFYTDSNGREMVKRMRDQRGPSYPPLVVNEPVAGNYYPVNSLISVDDGTHELAVAIDTSMGGSSMKDGEVGCPLLIVAVYCHAVWYSLLPCSSFAMCCEAVCRYVTFASHRAVPRLTRIC